MRIAIAADHRGFALKTELRRWLTKQGHTVSDLGTSDEAPVDYPDYAEAIARDIRKGQSERGVLICGSGVGACVAANKIPGIRAGMCHDGYSAHQGVEHDDMNVLVLGGGVVGPALAQELVSAFLRATFSGSARHTARLRKVTRLEETTWPPE